MKFSDLWTEKDGESLDLKRVFMIPAAMLTPIGLAIVDVVQHHNVFAVKDFCEGMAAIILALAALLTGHSWSKGENDPS